MSAQNVSASSPRIARRKDACTSCSVSIRVHRSEGGITGDAYLNDLLPLPYTEESLDIVVANVAKAQAAMGRRLLVENPASYLRYRHSTISESDFLAELVRRSGCGLLCDVNNIFVTCSNLGLNAESYLEALPAAAVGEIHIAGHSRHAGRSRPADRRSRLARRPACLGSLSPRRQAFRLGTEPCRMGQQPAAALGSAELLADEHLRRLRALIVRTEPFLVSEHLSWSIHSAPRRGAESRAYRGAAFGRERTLRRVITDGIRGEIAMTAAERREKARLRSERWRRAHGIGPRRPAQKPWLALGVSRSTYTTAGAGKRVSGRR
jgi:hypothetical protein